MITPRRVHALLVCSLIVGLFPTVALPETVEFTFNGVIDNEFSTPFGINIWNGPGPQPSTFQMTFDVNTLSPGNGASYTFGPSSMGPSIQTITAGFVATNLSFSLDGKTVLQGALGGFGFSGTPLGAFSFIGGFGGAGNDTASFTFVPDFGLGVTTEATLMESSDPLGLLLNGSHFSTDSGASFSFLRFGDSYLGARVDGGGMAVPEPNTLALMGLAGLCVGFVCRRRALGMMASV